MKDELSATPLTGAAALEHLTGSSRGSVTWLNASALNIYLGPDGYLRFSETRPGESRDDVIARLHFTEDTFELEASEGQSVWVNGVRVSSRLLEHGDMIEFGETGPLARFRLYRSDKSVRWAVADIVSDGLGYLRVSRQPFAKRVFRAFCQLLRRLTRETTILFRTAVVVAILTLAALTYQQDRLNTLLQQRFESDASRLDSFARVLARAQEEALTPSDLKGLGQELESRLVSNAERLAALERRSQASARVVASSAPSILFVQGAYGFRERSSGRMLRHVLDSEGRPRFLSEGQPYLSVNGDGPVANRKYTGTAFAVGDGGALVTNRHVALPWEDDAVFEDFADQELEPVMTKFIVYQPGKEAAIPVELVRASEGADLAVLRLTDAAEPVAGLRLGDDPPAAGDEVILMGYPAGIRAMLAQSGKAFIEELQTTEITDFWIVAARLAEASFIAPLASRGIIGQITPATIVYDAETTHGGSGGPVLDINGAVIAVNFAGVRDYSGSNLGVPVAKILALLKDASIL